MTGYSGHILTDADHYLILCFPDETFYVMPSDVITILCKQSSAPVYRIDGSGAFVETPDTIASSKNLMFLYRGTRRYCCQYKQVRKLLETQTGRVMIQDYESAVSAALFYPLLKVRA